MITFADIRQKCQFVSENSQFVTIDQTAVKTITNQPHQYWADGAYDFPPDTTLDQMMFIQFLTTSINFCFWRKPKWGVEKNGKKLGRSLSLITAQIDDTIWLASQTQSPTIKPYHKTLNIYY